MTKSEANQRFDDIKSLVKASANRPDLSGSQDGEFTGILMNQLAGAIFAGPRPQLEMVEAMQHAAQAAIRGISPADPVEGMFAAQMVTTHFAAMECYRRAAIPEQTFEGRRQALEFANKLVRSYTALAEALNKHRGKGPQIVRVEHVTVQAGGQAIVGSVSQGGGSANGNEDRPHAQRAAHAEEPALWCQDSERQTLSIACDER